MSTDETVAATPASYAATRHIVRITGRIRSQKLQDIYLITFTTAGQGRNSPLTFKSL